MKVWSCALAAALGLMVAVTPGKVQADEVQVTINLALTGSATACSGGPCVEGLNASFLWDTSTQSVVPDSISDTITGPINYGTVTISGTSTDLQTEFSDGIGDFFTLGMDLGAGSPVLGTYTGTSGPGSIFLAGNACVSAKCIADLSNGTISAASVTVVATPEPGSGLLFVMGLLGLIAIPLALKRFGNSSLPVGSIVRF